MKMTDEQEARAGNYNATLLKIFTDKERMTGDLKAPPYLAHSDLVVAVDLLFDFAKRGDESCLARLDVLARDHHDSIEDNVVMMCRLIDLVKADFQWRDVPDLVMRLVRLMQARSMG